MLFQTLPPTRFDLRFTVIGIPVRVHPLFWLIALLLGSSGALIEIPIWIFVVFVSVLIHEMGHALAFRWYGIHSQIVLHAMGGLTVPVATAWGTGWASVSPNPKQQIVISLAGPFAGFAFAALVMAGVAASGGALLTSKLFGFLPLPLTALVPFGGNLPSIFLTMLLFVNIFWGLFNLLPVYPLDGGQVTRSLLVQFDPLDGARKALWVSVVTGAIIALFGLLAMRSVYIALLFGLLAFQSYQSLRFRY
ncbi:MAG: site-2 protease family protein [Anaerolineales bacterium]|nr:site-2 protease family protein [Anaerolineales bacterium]